MLGLTCMFPCDLLDGHSRPFVCHAASTAWMTPSLPITMSRAFVEFGQKLGLQLDGPAVLSVSHPCTCALLVHAHYACSHDACSHDACAHDACAQVLLGACMRCCRLDAPALQVGRGVTVLCVWWRYEDEIA